MTQESAPVVWSWQFKLDGATEWVDYPGANGTSFTTPRLEPSMDQIEIRAVATSPASSPTALLPNSQSLKTLTHRKSPP
jgi:hypothetical protein